ncbi:MAG: restriction endonuclease [Thermoleophilia bacterium]
MIFFQKTRRELDRRRWELDEKKRELAKEQAEIDERLQTLNLRVRDRVAGYEHIAQAWADWEQVRADGDARYLRSKKHPAHTAAEVVKEKGREMAGLRRRMKFAEYLTSLYEFHFPWLEEFRDLEAEIDYAAATSINGDESREDPASRFLSKDEWAALTTAERNQLALERYLHSRQTPWQIGRDYERYVGYLREQAGCTVTYHGIVKGFEDLGRDVLAERDGTIEVIQCKRWAQHKVIHEKHIFQLFGTMVAAQIENPGKKVTGTFTTTTALSDRAREFAHALEIHVEENFPLGDYPRIKCNIARRTGERIYHLPFDQQYDSTVVEPERGELYAATCADAEAAGFRRAWRWKGGDS